MKSLEFSAMIERCALALEHRIANQRTIDLWYDDCQHIPSIAAPHIEAGLRQAGAWPKNVPAACRDLWHEWLRLNPKARAHDTDVPCPDGCLAGWILYYADADAEQKCHAYAVACGTCRRQRQEKRFDTIASLRQRGKHLARQMTGPNTDTVSRRPTPSVSLEDIPF